VQSAEAKNCQSVKDSEYESINAKRTRRGFLSSEEKGGMASDGLNLYPLRFSLYAF